MVCLGRSLAYIPEATTISWLQIRHTLGNLQPVRPACKVARDCGEKMESRGPRDHGSRTPVCSACSAVHRQTLGQRASLRKKRRGDDRLVVIGRSMHHPANIRPKLRPQLASSVRVVVDDVSPSISQCDQAGYHTHSFAATLLLSLAPISTDPLLSRLQQSACREPTIESPRSLGLRRHTYSTSVQCLSRAPVGPRRERHSP
ncbi:hypothetical protein B0I35DRAFT_202172 [Stachybotrys elegans]|uniref:Uncharacterized protein n=1 Tax=Stachybotrys elegans TaxID=80388 RepID=A0A8K0WRY4_9HYPO|nr:hypothetical protein B0I35DRAFT_202172 [Stachybotrys elegans]